ncbi:MAG: PRC-barrel domain-containing protein [Phycisphaeraceae bacterium]|nr:PRC-barrel domain-containing protein [Phycisphaeraceae bacterium]
MSTMRKRLMGRLGIAALFVSGVALAEPADRTAAETPNAASGGMEAQHATSPGDMTPRDQTQGMNPWAEQPLAFVCYSDIDDVHVQSAKSNEDLGVISDVIIRRHSGDIRYLVLRSGGVLGVGAKQTAVPFRAFETLGPDENGNPRLRLNMTSQQIEQAPDFDAQKFSELQYTTWRQQMNQYYQQISADWTSDDLADDAPSWRLGSLESSGPRDTTPVGERREGRASEAAQAARQSQAAAEPRQDMTAPAKSGDQASQGSPEHVNTADAPEKVSTHLCLLSQIDDSDLRARTGDQDIGEVEDLVVELDSGKTAFLIVDPADSVTKDDANRLVPYAAVSLGADQKIHLSGPSDALSTAATVPEDLDRLSDKSFRKEIYKGFGVGEEDFQARGVRAEGGRRQADASRGLQQPVAMKDEHVHLSGQVVRFEKNAGAAQTADDQDRQGQVSLLTIRSQDGQERTVEIDPSPSQSRTMDFERGDPVVVDAIKTSRNGEAIYMAWLIRSGNQELRFSGVKGDDLSRYE